MYISLCDPVVICRLVLFPLASSCCYGSLKVGNKISRVQRDHRSIEVNLLSDGRCGGLTASVLCSRSSGSGFEPSRGHIVVFLGKRHRAVTVTLSTQVYKGVPVSLISAGDNPAMDLHPIQEE